MGVPYPEEYGGGGADTLSYALVIEELARFPRKEASACRAVASPNRCK
jgi:alkylation response protein AidB-like acyl-CoA dehydrogenase